MAEFIEIRRTPETSGDLVGAVEASEILGVERTRIARYVRTGVMPPPVARLRATRVWLREDVERLAHERAEEKRIEERRRAQKKKAQG